MPFTYIILDMDEKMIAPTTSYKLNVTHLPIIWVE